MLDDATGDILWLKFSSSQDSENIVFCVCYLPPSESTRVNDSELFYATLLEHVYSYQNEGRIIMCGDFNSRVGEATEFIEGVDDVTPRNVIDYTSNVNGDLLIEFLVDCGMGALAMLTLLMCPIEENPWLTMFAFPMNSWRLYLTSVLFV